MITFAPEFTEIIFFDLEFYVPQQDRPKQHQDRGVCENYGRSSLVYNAAKPGHYVLGGVFRRWFPFKEAKPEEATSIWNFNEAAEKQTLSDIYKYFSESWKMIEARDRRENPDLILVGTGICRVDLPALYVRSVMHEIDSNQALYETYFKAKPVDLGELAIPFFPKSQEAFALYPKTGLDILKELKIDSPPKPSGMKVWKMVDDGKTQGVEARTASEVDDIIATALEIIRRCKS
jgi:hypothetical protein